MPGIDFYGMPISSAGRTVLSVGKELGINFNIKLVNIMEKEQLKPEFLAVCSLL
jgi:glutathione S-transferase